VQNEGESERKRQAPRICAISRSRYVMQKSFTAGAQVGGKAGRTARASARRTERCSAL